MSLDFKNFDVEKKSIWILHKLVELEIISPIKAERFSNCYHIIITTSLHLQLVLTKQSVFYQNVHWDPEISGIGTRLETQVMTLNKHETQQLCSVNRPFDLITCD